LVFVVTIAKASTMGAKASRERTVRKVAAKAAPVEVVDESNSEIDNLNSIAPVAGRLDVPLSFARELHASFKRFTQAPEIGMTFEEYQTLALQSFPEEQHAAIRDAGVLRKAFEKFDTNKVCSFLSCCPGEQITPNKDGRLQFVEFATSIVHPTEENSDRERLQRWRDCLMQLDLNGDGLISDVELRTVLERLLPPSDNRIAAAEAITKKVFLAVDTNHDDKLSSEEIFASLEKDPDILFGLLLQFMATAPFPPRPA
jgi:hypothetical protein